MLLSFLIEGDRHGYDLVKELKIKAQRHADFKSSSIYTLLHRLEVEGLVSSYNTKVTQKRIRTYYHIEKAGLDYLHRAIDDYNDFHSLSIKAILDGVSKNEL